VNIRATSSSSPLTGAISFVFRVIPGLARGRAAVAGPFPQPAQVPSPPVATGTLTCALSPANLTIHHRMRFPLTSKQPGVPIVSKRNNQNPQRRTILLPKETRAWSF
jgi:hypothetical protein